MTRPPRKSPDPKDTPKPPTVDGTRETVESIVIAIILAFLFRAFEAEAFVIPTGSMAPTLQGRHMDVFCDQCGHQYRAGASCENADSQFRDLVIRTLCPICRYPMEMNRVEVHRMTDSEIRRLGLEHTVQNPANPNHGSFMGDRILVCKFVYDLSEPRRWDVIVFKFPENAKQNYIKRLIGLPGEAITIKHGDIFVQKPGDKRPTIARKPPYKVKAMLQLVDDTNHIGQKLIDANWPSRWQQWAQDDRSTRNWQVEYDGTKQRFRIDGAGNGPAWLRYRHLVPQWSHVNFRENDWYYLDEKELPPDMEGGRSREGQLICDFYAYNFREQRELNERVYSANKHMGNHWVGDLGVECDVNVESDAGELLLSLVEGGVEYRCWIDIESGQAKLSICDGNNDQPGLFNDGSKEVLCKKPTRLKGQGQYRLRFSNVDDQLMLWVDENVIKFASTTEYDPTGSEFPRWSPYKGDGSERKPSDAEPVGIGSRGAALTVNRLRVLRDVYYVATDPDHFSDYQDDDYRNNHVDRIRTVMISPSQWAKESRDDGRDKGLFLLRNELKFPALEEDQFMPLGDNSPSSSDARYWRQPFVERHLLTGKALFIYWPHEWRSPLPITPNFSQRFIR